MSATALVLILAASLAVALAHSAPAVRTAPPLPSHVLAGAPMNVEALRGRPTLIAFFASWCGPCIAEAPTVERAAQALRGRANVVAVDWSDSTGSGLAFVRRFHWSFSVLADARGTAGYAYGIQGLPTAFVLNARGQIVRRLVGPQTSSRIVQVVDRAT